METVILTTSILMLAILAGAYIHRKHHLENVARKIVIKADTPERFLFLQNAMRVLQGTRRIWGLEINSNKRKVEFYAGDSGEDHREFDSGKSAHTSSENPSYYHPHSTTW